MIVLEENSFAVLNNERKFSGFLRLLNKHPSITHVYIVTDSEEAFQEMASRIENPNVVQLYRDYLENFVINKGGDA